MRAIARLGAMRRRAESLMTDTVVVRYPTGRSAPDPSTGTVSTTYADRFTSKCKVQSRNVVVADAEVGGRTSETMRAELHLPVDAPAVEPGDVCEVTAVGSLSDVSLLGRKFTVQGSTPPKSFATARRLEVEEVVS